MKTCSRCSTPEWPCFLVDGLCRMCQARRRDEIRGLLIDRRTLPVPKESRP